MKQKNNRDDFREGIFIILITVLSFGGLMTWSKYNPINPEVYWEECDESYMYYTPDEIEDYTEEMEEEEEIYSHLVTVTKYNPVIGQCDADPLITADGSFIDTLKLNKGEIKWIAISRDLRKDYNYGDTVIISGSGDVDGEYIIHDTMNSRWTSRIDILSPNGDSLGIWNGVSMRKK